MLHNHGLGGRGDFRRFDEDVNPMDSLTNLADVMLVFACGIMLALILNWNVDVGGLQEPVEVEQGNEVTDVTDLGQGEGILSENGKYEEMGVVYRDPETGTLYMVEKNE
ncbi:MAG: DUF2149 domain-containing protein [Anaerovoracaceae bacterium]